MPRDRLHIHAITSLPLSRHYNTLLRERKGASRIYTAGKMCYTIPV